MIHSDLSLSVATSDEINEITERLKQHLICASNPIPASWILQPEPTETSYENIHPKAELSRLIMSVEFANSHTKELDMKLYCLLDDEEIERISNDTIGQWNNELFRVYKKLRLTASNLGFILSAIERNSYPPSLFGRLLNNNNLDRVSILRIFRLFIP